VRFQAVSKEFQGLAQGVFGIVVLVGPALGPTLGGFLTDALGWRWIVFINLPFGSVTVLLAQAFMTRDGPSARNRSVDWLDNGGIRPPSLGGSCAMARPRSTCECCGTARWPPAAWLRCCWAALRPCPVAPSPDTAQSC
jgi:MFS family permease